MIVFERLSLAHSESGKFHHETSPWLQEVGLHRVYSRGCSSGWCSNSTTETTTQDRWDHRIECFQLPNLVGTDTYMLKNQDKVQREQKCTRKVQNTKYPGAEKTSDQTILSKKSKVTYKLYWSWLHSGSVQHSWPDSWSHYTLISHWRTDFTDKT